MQENKVDRGKGACSERQTTGRLDPTLCREEKIAEEAKPKNDAPPLILWVFKIILHIQKELHNPSAHKIF